MQWYATLFLSIHFFLSDCTENIVYGYMSSKIMLICNME